MHFIAPAEKTAVIFEELGFRYIGPDRRPQLRRARRCAADRQGLRPSRAAARAHRQRQGLRAGRARFAHLPRRRRERVRAQRRQQEDQSSGAPSEVPRRLRRRDDRGGREGSARRRHHRGDARRHRPREVRQSASRSATSTSASPRRTPCASRRAWRSSGLRPVCAIYSTFLQRAYDQIVHDVVVQNLPVVFCMDRAGFVGDDGPTHMGLYDIAYLRTLPNLTLMAPRNEAELLPMLEHALDAQRAGRRSAIRAVRPPATTTSRSRRSFRARPKCCAAAAVSRSSPTARTVDIALDATSTASRERRAADRRQCPLLRSRSMRRCCSNSSATTRTSSRWRSTRSPAASARPSRSSSRIAG